MVYPQVDFPKFDEQVYLSTVQSGDSCPATIQSVTQQVSAALTGDDATLRSKVMEAFGAYDQMDNGDFA